jgi:ParB-like chromosome segregation protein Spo0J
LNTKYAILPTDKLKTRPDSAFSADKKAKILSDIQENGIKNPVSVVYDGEYKVTRGHSRCWAAKVLEMNVPCVIFEQKPQDLGEPLTDIHSVYEDDIKIKPSGTILIKGRYW